eukprot:TRINITY_DN70462_c0_g1_i1.p1 TRINITY_DN70462_c0_g1~~TRINITY_DN70462_c0_g1_i1.p1  ORF type:complete len:1031 (+),score=82.44 TRINITY_DN70462_c0_g1_i1:51-3143(+)
MLGHSRHEGQTTNIGDPTTDDIFSSSIDSSQLTSVVSALMRTIQSQSQCIETLDREFRNHKLEMESRIKDLDLKTTAELNRIGQENNETTAALREECKRREAGDYKNRAEITTIKNDLDLRTQELLVSHTKNIDRLTDEFRRVDRDLETQSEGAQSLLNDLNMVRTYVKQITADAKADNEAFLQRVNSQEAEVATIQGLVAQLNTEQVAQSQELTGLSQASDQHNKSYHQLSIDFDDLLLMFSLTKAAVVQANRVGNQVEVLHNTPPFSLLATEATTRVSASEHRLTQLLDTLHAHTQSIDTKADKDALAQTQDILIQTITTGDHELKATIDEVCTKINEHIGDTADSFAHKAQELERVLYTQRNEIQELEANIGALTRNQAKEVQGLLGGHRAEVQADLERLVSVQRNDVQELERAVHAQRNGLQELEALLVSQRTDTEALITSNDKMRLQMGQDLTMTDAKIAKLGADITEMSHKMAVKTEIDTLHRSFKDTVTAMALKNDLERVWNTLDQRQSALEETVGKRLPSLALRDELKQETNVCKTQSAAYADMAIQKLDTELQKVRVELCKKLDAHQQIMGEMERTFIMDAITKQDLGKISDELQSQIIDLRKRAHSTRDELNNSLQATLQATLAQFEHKVLHGSLLITRPEMEAIVGALQTEWRAALDGPFFVQPPRIEAPRRTSWGEESQQSTRSPKRPPHHHHHHEVTTTTTATMHASRLSPVRTSPPSKLFQNGGGGLVPTNSVSGGLSLGAMGVHGSPPSAASSGGLFGGGGGGGGLHSSPIRSSYQTGTPNNVAPLPGLGPGRQFPSKFDSVEMVSSVARLRESLQGLSETAAAAANTSTTSVVNHSTDSKVPLMMATTTTGLAGGPTAPQQQQSNNTNATSSSAVTPQDDTSFRMTSQDTSFDNKRDSQQQPGGGGGEVTSSLLLEQSNGSVAEKLMSSSSSRDGGIAEQIHMRQSLIAQMHPGAAFGGPPIPSSLSLLGAPHAVHPMHGFGRPTSPSSSFHSVSPITINQSPGRPHSPNHGLK